MFGYLNLKGSIPIIYGVSGLEEFAPGKHSFIDVRDFHFNMTAVGDYLNYLDKNETAFDEYHQWRYGPPNKKFVTKVWKHSTDSFNCRTCLWIAKQKLEDKRAKVSTNL